LGTEQESTNQLGEKGYQGLISNRFVSKRFVGTKMRMESLGKVGEKKG